ncbi:MAG TPA: ABC transporter permease [Desulfosporosinus sp.]|nr:ABC transporter permease [Desulfosporosinus sp.]
MITVPKLLWQRLASDWKYQYEAWKTAVDWVVALYIVIPFLGIFIYEYLGWWREMPSWLIYVNLNAFFGVTFFFTWVGTTRIFLEAADQLFLLQKKSWIHPLIKLSLGYTIGYNVLTSILWFLILAPFLLHYGVSPREIVWMTLFTSGFKTCMGISKQFVELRFMGWIQKLVKIVLMIMAGIYWRQSVYYLMSHSVLFYLSLIVLSGVFVGLLFKRVTLRGTFFQDVVREKNARLRLVKLLLQNMGTYEKKPMFTRKRPLFFRSSNLLFKKRTPVNGLVEMFLKAESRQEKDVTGYFKILGTSIVAMILFPSDYGWLLWVAFSLMITGFIGALWRVAINNPFVCLFPWLSETKVPAARKSIFLMALPGQLFLGLVVVIRTQAWLGGLVMMPIAILIGYYSAKSISLKS